MLFQSLSNSPYKEDVKQRWSFFLKPKVTVLEEGRKTIQNIETTLFNNTSKHIRLGVSIFTTASLPLGILSHTFSSYHRLYYLLHHNIMCMSVVSIK